MRVEPQYDLVVIGAGPGGYATALRAAELGLSVAMVERDNTPGGTCLHRGCIPTKALIHAARTIYHARRAERFGISMQVNGIDFGLLQDYKNNTVRTMTEGLAGLLKFRKVTVIHGEASLLAAKDDHADGIHQVIVHNDEGTMTITGGNIVLATGSRPKPLPGINFFSQSVLSSDAALELNTFPQSAIIIGSGAIALEFASLWKAAGQDADITLMIRKDRVLSGWDRRAGMTLTRELKRHGINVITHSNVTGIDTGVNLGASVHYQVRSGSDDAVEEHVASAELVLAAIGRLPNTEATWFESAGIERTAEGRVVTDKLGRTNIPGIWAVGDITNGHQLAHRAFAQGMMVAESIAGLDPEPVHDETVPQIVFSTPEAASIGLTKAQASEDFRYMDVQETVYPMLSNARTLMAAESGSITLVTAIPCSDASSKHAERIVIGAHMVGPEVSELAAEAEQIIGNRTPLSQAARLIHPHPTFSEALGETLLKADGRPLHIR